MCAPVCMRPRDQCLIVLMWYMCLCSPLRLAKSCAAGWFATATTPTPTCSAAPSATPDWAASVCTRTACSHTAAGTHGWRTASSASAWWVGTDKRTPTCYMWNLHCRNLIYAFIQSHLRWELKQHVHSLLCNSAHTRYETNTLVSMEMLMNEKCSL